MGEFWKSGWSREPARGPTLSAKTSRIFRRCARFEEKRLLKQSEHQGLRPGGEGGGAELERKDFLETISLSFFLTLL